MDGSVAAVDMILDGQMFDKNTDLLYDVNSNEENKRLIKDFDMKNQFRSRNYLKKNKKNTFFFIIIYFNLQNGLYFYTSTCHV